MVYRYDQIIKKENRTKFVVVALAIVLLVSSLSVGLVTAKKGGVPAKDDVCVTIQDKTLEYKTGHYLETELLEVGFDEYGYNYQGHMFSGYYADSYLGGDGYPVFSGDRETYLAENPGVDGEWYWPYTDVKLDMKWNDAWIANTDCSEDGQLDRHFGTASYFDSGAWLTNHQSGEYYSDWNVSGDWVVNVEYNGVNYPENLILEQTATGITGTLELVGGGSLWTITSGSVTSDEVEFFGNLGSRTVQFEGVISSDGTMSGDWYDVAGGTRTGTWTSTSGEAARTLEHWNYFVKIVAATSEDEDVGGVWYNAEGDEIGPVIWGQFAIVQQVENDSGAGLHGLQYVSPTGAGLGNR